MLLGCAACPTRGRTAYDLTLPFGHPFTAACRPRTAQVLRVHAAAAATGVQQLADKFGAAVADLFPVASWHLELVGAW